MRFYKYFLITIQPKHCDGSKRSDDYLTQSLVTELDEYFTPYTGLFSRKLERNSDKIGHHYHIAFAAKAGHAKEQFREELEAIVQHHYHLTDAGKEKSIDVKQKTKTSMFLCACGYLCKSGLDDYITNIPDETFQEFQEKYKNLQDNSKKANFKKWVLDPDKTLSEQRDINTYYLILDIVIEHDNITNINTFNFAELIYLFILVNYKISFSFSNIKIFHRQIIQYFISKGLASELDSETLVNFISFRQSVIPTAVHTKHGVVTKDILSYFKIQ